MLRRWGILLAMLALTAGTTLAASSASAATMGFSPGGPIHLVGASPHLRGGISHQAESTNWSGYAATTGTYTSVSASWTARRHLQPRRPVRRVLGRPRRLHQQLGRADRQRGRLRRAAPRSTTPGTRCTRTPRRTTPTRSGPGDHFNASVTYTGNNSFSLYIADTTQGWSHTTTASLAGAARSSAEVIVEAPCCTASGGILPLTNFGTVNIAGSTANGAALGNAGGVTQIIMIDNAGRDKDTVSSLSGGENFSATWLRSN